MWSVFISLQKWLSLPNLFTSPWLFVYDDDFIHAPTQWVFIENFFQILQSFVIDDQIE